MKKLFLILGMLWFGISTLFSQGIAGTWNGTLEIGPQKLRLVLNITEKDGAYVSTMDSPDQGAKGIPVKKTSFDGRTLKISAPDLGMTYEGNLNNGIIEGSFSQSGFTIPLKLERGKAETLKRPQDPTPPYPYNSEDVTFYNKEAGITLAGTFTYPKAGKKSPAVVLITGSGPQNRDEEILNHKPFLVLADHLTRNGIAVLRFDDRGVGESGGDYDSATIQNFATDASAAMDYLKTRKEVDAKKTGLLGHSEGGQIAFIVGGERKDVAFIVSMAGPGTKGDILLKEQRRLIGLTSGAPQEAIDQNEQLVEIMHNLIVKHGHEAVHADTDMIVDETMAQIPAEMAGIPDLHTLLKGEYRKLASPELVSLMAYDPADDLARIKCPILALNGDKDLQVPADMNLDGIRSSFHGELTMKKYPGLNHLFQHAGTGLPAEYGVIEETISPEVLKDIADWINLKTNNRRK